MKKQLLMLPLTLLLSVSVAQGMDNSYECSNRRDEAELFLLRPRNQQRILNFMIASKKFDDYFRFRSDQPEVDYQELRDLIKSEDRELIKAWLIAKGVLD